AMAPDILEAVEISGIIFGPAGVVPEADRHGRKRFRADELALLTAHGMTLVVPHIDRHAERRPLDLAGPDRLHRHRIDEAGHDVGAARYRGQMHVLLDAVIDEGKTLRRKRRAGRGDD